MRGNTCKRNLCRDGQAIRFEGDELSWMAGDNAHRLNVQRSEDLCANPVLALLAPQSERFIRVGTVFAVVLQFIAALRVAFLMKIQKYTPSLALDHAQRAI